MRSQQAQSPKMPDFLIIGAGKCGTSSVYEYLKEHPEIHMSAVKETNFFALQGQNVGIDPQDDPEQQFHYPWSVTQLTDYQELFRDAIAGQAKGEASPMYLYSQHAPFRIKESIPNTKLIVFLRQPVERLYSRFMHLIRENRAPTSEFTDALDRQSIWWRRNDLVQEGFYFTHLRRYFELFPAHQIKVFLYEELRQNPAELMKQLYGFLGVDSSFQPSLGTEYNVSGKIKNPWADKVIGQDSIVKKWAEKSLPKLAGQLKQSAWLKSSVLSLRKKNLVKAPLGQALKKQMTESIYQHEILGLQQLLQRDLTHWLQ